MLGLDKYVSQINKSKVLKVVMDLECILLALANSEASPFLGTTHTHTPWCNLV